MANLQIKRVYEPGNADDEHRILVDRVWPRGINKGKLGDITWLKNSAPGPVWVALNQHHYH